MSDFLFLDRKTRKFIPLDSEEDIVQKIEFKISENRTKKIINFLNERTNHWKSIIGQRQVNRVLEENMMMFSMPMIFIYLPQYYQRIFLKLALLSSRKPGTGFGYCELNTSEFYMILSDWDKVVFKDVFKFLINSKIITINSEGKIKINSPYSFGVFGFNYHILKLIENTYNKFQNRNFKGKSSYTFLTDFEKL